MRTHVAALTLVLAATFIPELLTGSTPLLAFTNPVTLFFFFLGYGVAVLSIREAAVRWNLTFFGIFILGLVYGIFNEGFMSRTILLQDNLPIPQLSDYGYAFGISFPWAVFASVWHSVRSVLFPIVAVYALFPDMREVPWLGKKLFIASFASSAALIALVFAGMPKVLFVQGPLLALFLAILALVFVAYRFKNKVETTPTPTPTPTIETFGKKPLWFGLGATSLFLVLVLAVASLKWPVLFFFIIAGGSVALVLYILRNNNWIQPRPLLLFIIGCCVVSTLVSIATTL